MTQPSASSQPDMGRVVQRATDALALHAVAPLGVQLAMAQELAEMRGARVAELEQEASAARAQHAQQSQVIDDLTRRLQDALAGGHEADQGTPTT